MPEKRRHARIRPSGPSRSARIVVDSKTPAITCTIIDISAGGACLEVSDPAAVPRRFELVHGASRKKCSTVWKARYRLGVIF